MNFYDVICIENEGAPLNLTVFGKADRMQTCEFVRCDLYGNVRVSEKHVGLMVHHQKPSVGRKKIV